MDKEKAKTKQTGPIFAKGDRCIRFIDGLEFEAVVQSISEDQKKITILFIDDKKTEEIDIDSDELKLIYKDMEIDNLIPPNAATKQSGGAALEISPFPLSTSFTPPSPNTMAFKSQPLSASAPPSSDASWACTACTYFNEGKSKRCEVCYTARSPEPKSPKSPESKKENVAPPSPFSLLYPKSQIFGNISNNTSNSSSSSNFESSSSSKCPSNPFSYSLNTKLFSNTNSITSASSLSTSTSPYSFGGLGSNGSKTFTFGVATGNTNTSSSTCSVSPISLLKMPPFPNNNTGNNNHSNNNSNSCGSGATQETEAEANAKSIEQISYRANDFSFNFTKPADNSTTVIVDASSSNSVTNSNIIDNISSPTKSAEATNPKPLQKVNGFANFGPIKFGTEKKIEKSGNCFVCERETTYRCSECMKTFYCSRQCQKSSWKEHKSKCVKHSIWPTFPAITVNTKAKDDSDISSTSGADNVNALKIATKSEDNEEVETHSKKGGEAMSYANSDYSGKSNPILERNFAKAPGKKPLKSSLKDRHGDPGNRSADSPDFKSLRKNLSTMGFTSADDHPLSDCTSSRKIRHGTPTPTSGGRQQKITSFLPKSTTVNDEDAYYLIEITGRSLDECREALKRSRNDKDRACNYLLTDT